MSRRRKTHRKLQRNTRKFNWRTLKFEPFNDGFDTFTTSLLKLEEGRVKAELDKMEREQETEYGEDLFI
jgi:hypothetical protein